MISYHAKPLAVGPLLVLDALGKLTLKYNVQGSWRHDLVRFPFMFLRILQLFQFPGYLHIVNRSCASSQIEMCVHQSKSIRSIPHHFLLLYYKVDSQHTGTNIIQSLKKTSVCVCLCIFWLRLTSEGCKPRDCRRRGACGEPPETSKSHTLSERVATQGLSKSAAERHLREYASVPWLFDKKQGSHSTTWDGYFHK